MSSHPTDLLRTRHLRLHGREERLMDTATVRLRLTQHLLGTGLELGPGHNPFPCALPGIGVRYVDRWEPESNSELFPELGKEAVFPQPDITANLDSDRLVEIATDSEDFVIASHVLEHMAEPIGLLEDIHRVLKPGGVLLILLPDRHRTFDRTREPTSLSHLIAEHGAGVTAVDDGHIEEFLRNTSAVDVPAQTYIPEDETERQRYFDLHRRRSVHVHCWDQDEFVPVIRYTISDLGLRWELVDPVFTEEGGHESIEFGFVLRKSVALLPPSVLAQRWDLAWSAWQRRRCALKEREAMRAQLEQTKSELVALGNTRTFRYTRALRKAYGRLTSNG